MSPSARTASAAARCDCQEWQSELIDDGIKVLLLFFIDRVASYTAPDGLVRLLFDEEFEPAK